MTTLSQGIVILLLAAGNSRRMGDVDKLLKTLEGEPLLRRTARRASATGLPVMVLVRPDRPDRLEALRNLRVATLGVAGADEGISASIRAGLSALPADTCGVMMMMADMPDLQPNDLLALVSAFEEAECQTIVRAAARDGRPGSPAIIPQKHFAKLLTLSGDQGGKAVLGDEEEILVRLPAERALTDLDSPEDWDRWFATPRQ